MSDVHVDPEDHAIRPTVTRVEGAMKIVIPDGAAYRHPIRVVTGMHQSKVRIVIGKNSRACLIEELEEGTIHEVEVIVGEGSDVEFISINCIRAQVPVRIEQRSRLADNATIRWRNVTLGAGQVDHDLQSELTGADATSEIDWLFYAKNDEKYQLNARNIFTGRHGGGEITMKGVAEDSGHVRCNGKIEIGVGGGETDTYLTQDVLMLDKTAKVDAVPGLEIKTNDVKASHSAAVSRVTDEDLFYFAARGIIEREARRMFVEGFLGEMVAKISSESSQEEILASIEGKYGM